MIITIKNTDLKIQVILINSKAPLYNKVMLVNLKTFWISNRVIINEHIYYYKNSFHLTEMIQ